MESSFKAKPAQIISSATLQDPSDITIEREQLLHHTERTTVFTAKSNPSAPGFPKQTRKILKPEPGSRSSHIEELHCSYRFSSRLQYWYSIFR